MSTNTNTINYNFILNTAASLIATSNSNTIGNIFTTGGNVGIGISNPICQLTLGGSGDVLAFENGATIIAKNTVGSYETFMWPRWIDGRTIINYGTSGFDIRNNSFTTTMYLTDSGNVGINTNNPSEKIHINGGSLLINPNPGKLRITSAFNINFIQSGLDSNNNAELRFGPLYSSTPWMTITTSGNVGIGTGINIPNSNLHISSRSTSGEQPAILTLQNSHDTFARGQAQIRAVHDASLGAGNALAFFTREDSGANFDPTSLITEKMRIRNNGNVGIGTANPTCQLHVSGATSITLPAGYQMNASGVAARSSAADNVSIRASGSIWTESIFLASSDARIKKDILDVNDSSALDKLRLIQPKTYKYIDCVNKGDETVYGFIAQEVASVIPIAVSKQTSFVPDIYSRAIRTEINGEICLQILQDSSINPNFDIASFTQGNKLKIFDENLKSHICIIKRTENDSNIILEDKIVLSEYVFIYGKEVDDFNVLNKDYIWTITTTALQEVDKQLQAEKSTHETTKQELANLKTFLQSKYPGEI